MKQQVNLYLPELQPQLKVIQTKSILISSIGLICLLVVYQFILSTQVGKLKRTVEELENQQVVARQRLDIIRQAAKPKPSGHLDLKLKDLRREVSRREKLGLIIENQNFGNSDGFTGPMNVLAANSVDSIALERIRFTKGGGLLELRGNTDEPASVPNYIKTIHEEKPFSGTLFGQLSMGAQKGNVHRFSLGFESIYDSRKNNK